MRMRKRAGWLGVAVVAGALVAGQSFAADSPLVDDEGSDSQLLLAALVTYTFQGVRVRGP